MAESVLVHGDETTLRRILIDWSGREAPILPWTNKTASCWAAKSSLRPLPPPDNWRRARATMPRAQRYPVVRAHLCAVCAWPRISPAHRPAALMPPLPDGNFRRGDDGRPRDGHGGPPGFERGDKFRGGPGLPLPWVHVLAASWPAWRSAPAWPGMWPNRLVICARRFVRCLPASSIPECAHAWGGDAMNSAIWPRISTA